MYVFKKKFLLGSIRLHHMVQDVHDHHGVGWDRDTGHAVSQLPPLGVRTYHGTQQSPVCNVPYQNR